MPVLNTATLGDTSQMDLPDLGEVTSMPVKQLELAALEGPWVAIAGPLQGELMFDADGFCYFRPGDSLGHGIGVATLKKTAAGATVNVDLEVYRYSQQSREPPAEPERFTIAATAARASAASQQYSTLTLAGHLHRDGKHEGQFNAAKMEPWSKDQRKAYAPNPQMVEGFKTLFPEPFSTGRVGKPPLNLDSYRVGDISSVYYVPDYITPDDEAACMRQLAATPKELKRELDKRVVQEYGGQMCPECNSSFLADVTQPPWADELCNTLVHDGVFSATTFPNNVRIHEYAVGHGIAPHVDGPIYVPKVAILSLQSSVVMRFYPHRKPYEDAMEHYNDTFKFDGDIAKEKALFSLVLEPRSLLVFDADAYYFHPHGISDKEVDSLRPEDGGPVVNRHLLTQTPADAQEIVRRPRVGVTIRNLLSRCNHQPERAEWCMRRVWSFANPTKKPFEPSVSTTGAKPATQSSPTASPAAAPSTATSPYRSMSTAAESQVAAGTPMATSGTNVTKGDLDALHQRLDDIAATQKELQSAVKQLQIIAAHSATQASTFQSEVSGVLDHVSETLLDLHANMPNGDE